MFNITQNLSMRNAALLSVLAVSLIFSSASMARKGKRQGPPQQAFEACSGQTEGAACAFTGDRGDAEGTCITPPRGEETLVCAPERGQRGRDRNEDSETE